MRSFWSEVEALDNRIEARAQLAMLREARRLVERATRWLVRANPRNIDIAAMIHKFEPGAGLVARALPGILDGADRDVFDTLATELRQDGVPPELARKVAGMLSLLSVFDIVEVAAATGRNPEEVMAMYFRLGSRLQLNWLRDRITELPRASRWQGLARAALRDDLYSLHRALTHQVLDAGAPGAGSDDAIDAWSARNGAAVERCLGILADIRASRIYDTTTLPIALREVRNLIRESE
jgi:glutamate dehydrogenase